MAMWKAIVSQNAREEAARVECGATLTHALLAELARYHWPGNVRVDVQRTWKAGV